MIVFLTGASGVGKTTIVNELDRNSMTSKYDCYHFDSIGVPSMEEMREIEDWQKKTTYQWIDRLLAKNQSGTIVIEGSVNISFILSGFDRHGFKDFLILLIDCDEESMIDRLKERNQPELANDDMKRWLSFLRKQSLDLSIPRINTSKVNLQTTMAWLVEEIDKSS